MKYIEAAFLSALAVFAPQKAIMIATLALVLIDCVTGVIAAKKRGEPITSSGLKRTVGKLVLYELAIAMGFLCQQFLTGDSIPVCKMISTMIGLTEMKSILENIDSISGANTFKAVLDIIVQKKSEIE